PCWLKDHEKNQDTYASLEPLILQLGQNLAEKASALSRRAGFDKIVQRARVARDRGLQYVWVDTCCIDKTSSAELSEAINSMYQWYSAAEACFAFLSDVVHCEPCDGTETAPAVVDLPSESGCTRLSGRRAAAAGQSYHAVLEPGVYDAKGEKYAICHPMSRVRDQQSEPQSGEEMIRSPSGPVKIPMSSIPRGWPVTVVVLKEPPPPPRPSLGSCFFSIEAADHRHPGAVGADMGLLLVETCPPPLQVERSTPGSLSFRCQAPHTRAYLLRFVVAEEPARQFVVAVTIDPANLHWSQQSRVADDNDRPGRGITMKADFPNACPPSPERQGALAGRRGKYFDGTLQFPSLASAIVNAKGEFALNPFWTAYVEENLDILDGGRASPWTRTWSGTRGRTT
ncbi:het domain-containing protein, partial [Colletotrichum sojae]